MKNFHARKHELSSSSEYKIWTAMRARCGNPKCNGYKTHGARGISVCEQWSNFETFIKDMGRRPTPRHTVERIDNDGNYEPGNCKWATPAEQSRNKRNNVNLTLEGETMCLADWATRMGVRFGMLEWRIHHGWPVRAAIMAPKGMKAKDAFRVFADLEAA